MTDSVGLGVFEDRPLGERIPFLWDSGPRVRVQILPLPLVQMNSGNEWSQCLWASVSAFV